MRVSAIAFATAFIASPVMGSLFFQESKADRIKSNLQSIGYEVTDSAGLVKDSVIESFDPDSIKAWLEAHGVTDASKQTLEVAKQHKDWLLEDIKDYAAQSKDFSNALLSKGKEYYDAQSTAAADFFWSKWSDSKLKEFLDARGVNVPQHSTRDQLIALVSRSKYKSPINFNGPSGNYWFDGWSRDELVKKLQSAGQSIEGSRKELAQRLYDAYKPAYESGKEKGEEAADKVKNVVGDWKEATVDSFNNWSLDDLKEYLSDFGAEVSGTKDSLVDAARKNYNYFVHGEEEPQSLFNRVKSFAHNFHSTIHHYFTKLVGIQAFVRSDL